MSVTFYLRPEARFRDGTPVTAADVAFTFETLKQKGHPRYQLALRDVASATAIDPATIKYQFKGENVRDLPTLVASLPVFSKAYYTAHDFLKESLDPPRLRPLRDQRFSPGDLCHLQAPQGLLGGEPACKPRALQFR